MELSRTPLEVVLGLPQFCICFEGFQLLLATPFAQLWRLPPRYHAYHAPDVFRLSLPCSHMLALRCFTFFTKDPSCLGAARCAHTHPDVPPELFLHRKAASRTTFALKLPVLRPQLPEAASDSRTTFAPQGTSGTTFALNLHVASRCTRRTRSPRRVLRSPPIHPR